MSNTAASKRPRILFFGMEGNFSHPPLRALLEHGIEVCAVVIPAQHTEPDQPVIQRLEYKSRSRSMLPMLNSSVHTSILQIASEHQIPVWEVSRLSHPETTSVFASYQTDAICVACFSLRIPRSILTIPRLGCLNVHPSLLPANRGSEPLFWTFREGQRQTGVTIHLMDEGMDTGDIVAQEAIEIPDGISYTQLEARCATLGGILLAYSVWDLYKGLATPTKQDVTQSSYHPFPSANDFVINAAEWDARCVYNFICGIASWGGPITVQVGDASIHVKAAISYSQNEEAYSQQGEKFWIPCRAGSVKIEC
jgi:methionyl-tRNA formyltransferase